MTTDLYGDGMTANYAHALLLQPDGRLIAIGDSSFDGFRALRYTSDGVLDPSFGTSGIATADIRIGGTEFADAAVLQPDGKVVAAGYTYFPGPAAFALVRFDSDGTLDASFGIAGVVTTAFGGDGGLIHALALQSDGKLVAAGSPLYTLARYLADGTLDPSFGTGGIAQTDFQPSCCDRTRTAMRSQPDGRDRPRRGPASPFGSDDFGIAHFEETVASTRRSASGARSSSTSAAPTGPSHSPCNRTAKSLTAGQSRRRFALARLETDGSLDGDFGVGGLVRTAINGDPDMFGRGELNAVTLQPDGKIVGVGQADPIPPARAQGGP